MKRSLQPCIEPGCPTLVPRGRCLQHQRAWNMKRERINNYHDTPWRWVYNDPRWARLRATVRREQPLCARVGCSRPWTDLDHKTALADGGAPFDRANVHGLCKQHHSAKTAGEVNARR